MKVKEEQRRRVLYEGRTNGMAFGFLKKVDDETFKTVQPLSPCKDYLNEVVFTENTGIPSMAHGLKYPKKNNIFNDYSYLGIKILEPMEDWDTYNYSKSIENDINLLKQNFKHLESFMNQVEKEIGLDRLTTIDPADDDYFVVKFSTDWCKSGYSISLFTLLLRVAMVYDGSTDWKSFIDSYNYNEGDESLLQSAKPRLNLIMERKMLPPNRNPFSKTAVSKGLQTPHDYGIVAWNYEDPNCFEEVELVN